MWNDMVVPQWLITAVALVVLAALIGLVFWMRHAARAAQQRAFDGLEIFAKPAPGAVPVVFHTYYGFLVHTVQTEHRFWASPEDARVALLRLHRFNLIWGIFAYGALVIPLLSFGNYLAQRRSINRLTAPKSKDSGIDRDWV